MCLKLQVNDFLMCFPILKYSLEKINLCVLMKSLKFQSSFISLVYNSDYLGACVANGFRLLT